ncbi:glycosyltransferase [Amphritea opalescens]|uniref:Glycosyltransferase n=1 Tax=Amphritea opalescens TaxID=2490544 RepID=A0A430KUF1_9GAMM|nr:glycosyltransferase [Amphritea opalescens]RTE67155.1 glycosyltransferase [Amphritea opalescens]
MNMVSYPLVSVIIPVYNGATYIAEAVESILNQTYDNFEIIIVDDASSDNSLRIVNNYESNKIKIITNDYNVGVAASRNRGIKAAKGKYVAFMDSDDVSAINRLLIQVCFLESHPEFGLVSSHFVTFEDELETGKRSMKKLPVDSYYIAAALLFQSVICCPSAMMRVDILKEHNLFFNESFKVCEDWDLWYRMSQVTKISNVDEVLLYYRKHGGSLTKKREEMYRYKIMLIQKSFLDNGFDIKELFGVDYRFKGLAEFKEFTSVVSQLLEENGTTGKFVEEHLLSSCAYVLYEMYKLNVGKLGYVAYDDLRSSSLFRHMDIAIKYRLKNYILGKWAKLKA